MPCMIVPARLRATAQMISRKQNPAIREEVCVPLEKSVIPQGLLYTSDARGKT